MNIVLFGPPGAGKGTMATKLSSYFSIPHISTGDIFRKHISQKTGIGIKIKTILESGELIPDSLTTRIVSLQIQESNAKNGYILDGYPRTLPQAQWFHTHNTIHFYISFEIEESIIVQRLSGRRIHPASGRTYHVLFTPPKTPNKDDITGENLIQRVDDAPEKIKNRLHVYKKETIPVLDFIKTQPQYRTIDASQIPSVVFKNILATIYAI